MTKQRLLFTKEVAAALRCSPQRVRAYVAAGKLEPLRLSPRAHLRFRREDVEALIRGEKPDE